MTDPAERREYPRLETELPAEAWVSDDQPAMTGRTINIGHGGLKLRLDSAANLKKNDALNINIDSADLDERINLLGTVRWARPSPNNGGGQEVGIHLTGPDLARWVFFLDRLNRVLSEASSAD